MINKIKSFSREVKVELKKVVFPTREEVMGSTKIVIITVLIVALFLGIVDRGLSKLIELVLR
ncbi:MAG: preprotein translocase subunit SecE [Nitrospirae bacterium]|nr:preprotein translocase subunit SecE [Nitrospirota bacterium]